MKQQKIKKGAKKATLKFLTANKPLKMKTHVKAGGFEWKDLWSWVPGIGNGDK